MTGRVVGGTGTAKIPGEATIGATRPGATDGDGRAGDDGLTIDPGCASDTAGPDGMLITGGRAVAMLTAGEPMATATGTPCVAAGCKPSGDRVVAGDTMPGVEGKAAGLGTATATATATAGTVGLAGVVPPDKMVGVGDGWPMTGGRR